MSAFCEGPLDAPLVIIGEAPGETEELMGRPFVGASGRLLNQALSFAGVQRADTLILNVFDTRPPGNNIEAFFGPRSSSTSTLPPLRPGKYISDVHRSKLDRFFTQLAALSGRTMLLLGNTALWAVTGKTRISDYRGTTIAGANGNVLVPTFHPAAVLRNMQELPAFFFDVRKWANAYRSPPTIPTYSALINPTIDELREAFAAVDSTQPAAVDIETAQGQMTAFGFAQNRKAVVVPFWDLRRGSYWPDAETEVEVWRLVQRFLLSPTPKVFHNGLYDIQYLWFAHGLRVNNFHADTMFIHHTLQPELRKSLGFLASIHLNNPAWKSMRQEARAEAFKRDD